MDDEVKGIATITLNGQNVSAYSSWTTQCLPFTATEIAAATFAPVTAPASTSGYPTLYKGTFTISGAASDTFLKMDGWTKGIAWVNGFNLGRYWQPVGQYDCTPAKKAAYTQPSEKKRQRRVR